MLLTGVLAWPGAAQRGAKRDLALTTHPLSHICSDIGCSQPKYSQFLGLKTTVVWSAPGTKWPSLTTSALHSCPAGACVLGEVLLLPHPRDWGLRLDEGSHMPLAGTHRQGLMASFLVPSLPGAPNPGVPSSTPTLSTQDHFWEPASLPIPFVDLQGQPQRKESNTGCIRWEEDQGPPWG